MTTDQSLDNRLAWGGEKATREPAERPDKSGRAKLGEGSGALGGEGAAEQIATVNELAAAVEATSIFRLVVLSTHRELQSFGGLQIARRLSGSGRATVLIDLTPDGSVGSQMGLPRDCAGYGDLLSGGAGLAEVIYRDHYTSTHFVPCGGFELEQADEAAFAHLSYVLDAFAEAYDCTVIEADAFDIPELPALLNENTAVVIAGLPHVDDRMIDVADDLRQIGIDDIVFMPMVRRDVRG
ncbi:hypothetical protein [Jiella mangrovi]|uniref:Exopolysaccharide biosynthesis protein n=1 Tax=Jiella mangrovi TaxID=2821407 RepID=A0ABS4BLA6_9HYPH|nr:hypothetical protein [Jiella mangrovi]MBP0617520.1 hypothetical protein [Jiella mangrovi]